MRWKIKERANAPAKDISIWHRWYAWFPVKVYDTGHYYWVWREYIETRGMRPDRYATGPYGCMTFYDGILPVEWEYRFPID